jgi:hypothetical protein
MTQQDSTVDMDGGADVTWMNFIRDKEIRYV